jgi:hypothetical protein
MWSGAERLSGGGVRRNLENLAIAVGAIYFLAHFGYKILEYNGNVIKALVYPTKYFSRLSASMGLLFFLIARFRPDWLALRATKVFWDTSVLCLLITGTTFGAVRGLPALTEYFPSSALNHLVLPMVALVYWLRFRESENLSLADPIWATALPAAYIAFLVTAELGYKASVYKQSHFMFESWSLALLYAVLVYAGVLLISVSLFAFKISSRGDESFAVRQPF